MIGLLKGVRGKPREAVKPEDFVAGVCYSKKRWEELGAEMIKESSGQWQLAVIDILIVLILIVPALLGVLLGRRLKRLME